MEFGNAYFERDFLSGFQRLLIIRSPKISYDRLLTLLGHKLIHIQVPGSCHVILRRKRLVEQNHRGTSLKYTNKDYRYCVGPIGRLPGFP